MEKLFLAALSMSGTASVVILMVLLARLILSKAPKVFSYALWAVVLFRLLCPFSIESGFSLAPSIQVRSRGDRNDYPMVEIDVSSREMTITVDDTPVLPDSHTPSAPGIPDLSPDAPTTAAHAAPGRWFIAGVVWLTGTGLLMGYSLFSMLKLRRKLVGSVPLAGEKNVRLADHIPSPFVLGLVRPQIYLPSGLRERERDYILLHERTHIARFDHVTRALAWLALSIHWFNPLVWLSFYLAGKDMEMSCDEAVLRKMGREIRADYSSSLLRLSVGGKLPAGPLAFGGGNLQSRIKNVLHYKKPALWVIGLALIAVVCAGAALVTSPGGIPEQGPSGIGPEDLTADLTFSLNEDGPSVKIEGSIDGIELEHTRWFTPSWFGLYDDLWPKLGLLEFEMPLCDNEVVCGLDARWTDESRTAVRVTATPRARFSSYFPTGNLVFTVDLSEGTLLELYGYIPKTYANAPELVPTEEEAMRTARVAAKLLTGAEEYYQSHAGESSSLNSDMIYDDAEALAAYRAVLSGNATFHDTGAEKDLDIAHIYEVFNPEFTWFSWVPIYFTVIDLDGDGVREVVLMLDSYARYGYEILHYQDGAVYGYYTVPRGFEDLKTDGTYEGSGSAFSGTVERIERLLEDRLKREILAEYDYHAYDYEDENEVHEYFAVNGQKASSAQIESVLSQQRGKESVQWYELTGENLDAQLP